jgi:CHASE3 domain sensor protein
MRGAGTIRGRMARMLALPLVTVLGLLGFIVVGEVGGYRDATTTSDAVRLTLAAQDLVHELQRERGLTNGLLGGEARYRSDVNSQRVQADQARAALDAQVSGDPTADSAAVRSALELLDDLGPVRGGVDAGSASRAATFDYYTAAIDALSSVDLGSGGAKDDVLRQHLAALRALGDAKEAAAKERGFLNGVFAVSSFHGDEYARFSDIRATKRRALAEFDRFATAQQRAESAAALRSPAATLAAGYEDAAVRAADGRALSVDARLWWDAMTSVVNDLREVQRSVGDDAQARAAELRRSATIGLIVVLVLAVLIVQIEALLLLASARSITKPLAALAREADDLATRRLPEAVALIQSEPNEPPPLSPVRVSSLAGAEVRQVAGALERVQQVAYSLATEQAVLRRNTTESLANLGRRNQNLLRRQLSFISQLEREEADPSALANLFELDHLATRMRRNAESVLVLVGEASPRRWAAPLPVADVVRAAMAEVEEYRRVDLRRIDDAFVAGSVVTDVAHMIAELVENGLAFSPPDLDVEIYGRWTGTEYLIAIVDQGIGMTSADLDTANARLRGDENFLVGPARFLGHYVVGRLARELGAAVQLAHSPVTGVTARLVLPAAVLAAAREQVPAETAREPMAATIRAHAPSPVSAQAPARHRPVAALVAGPAAAAETVTMPAQWWGLSTDPSPPTESPADPGRTRNGLVKRRRRQGVLAAPAAKEEEDDVAVGRPPEEVRTLLSTFRAGTRRGESPASSVPDADTKERGLQ